MTVNELIEELKKQKKASRGGFTVHDTDGHPIIGLSVNDENTDIYIESEF